MNKVNYQKLLDTEIAKCDKDRSKKSLLLHACCAPCSSYCLEYLKEHFKITALFYNPNIYPMDEFVFRNNELKRLICEMGLNDIECVTPNYDSKEFFSAVKGYEHCAEGGDRCKECFKLRLRKTAEIAKKHNFDYFTTTLSISPLKNAELLNKIGEELSNEYGVKYLFSDFKKKNGYIRSIELSKKYNLYRQNYCGCVYSKND